MQKHKSIKAKTKRKFLPNQSYLAQVKPWPTPNVKEKAQNAA